MYSGATGTLCGQLCPRVHVLYRLESRGGGGTASKFIDHSCTLIRGSRFCSCLKITTRHGYAVRGTNSKEERERCPQVVSCRAHGMLCEDQHQLTWHVATVLGRPASQSQLYTESTEKSVSNTPFSVIGVSNSFSVVSGHYAFKVRLGRSDSMAGALCFNNLLLKQGSTRNIISLFSLGWIRHVQ